MKKKVTMLVILCALSVVCKAQTFIPKIGFSRSSISGEGDRYVDFKHKSGFIGGLAFNKPVMTNLSVQAELLYSQKGFKRVEGVGDPFTSMVTLNYLQLPILVQYCIKNVFLFGGPSIAYGLNGWVKNSARNYESYNRIVFHKISKDQFYYNFKDADNRGGLKKRWEFGFVFGLGVKIKNFLVVDCRYDPSITKLFSNKKDVQGDLGTGGNRSFQITVGMPINKLKIGV